MPQGVVAAGAGGAQPRAAGSPGPHAEAGRPGRSRLDPVHPPTAQCELTSAAETVTTEPGRTSTLSCQGM
jgi:hypothetical protein